MSKTEGSAPARSRFVMPATSRAWLPLFGLAALALLVFPSQAGANEPNFPLLIGVNAWLIATVPATILIEGAAVRRFSDFSWPKALIAACVLYLFSTSIGTIVGGNVSFALYAVFLNRGEVFYQIGSTIEYGIINAMIELLALRLIYRLFLGWVGMLVLFMANILTTGLIFFA